MARKIDLRYSYVAVEGPIGVGKTTLARLIAKKTGAKLLKEDIQNPFLEPFYEGKKGAAFQCQIFFLLTRFQQRDPNNDSDRTQKHFFVNAEEIREKKYDLSINRYKEMVYEEEKYEPPQEILNHMVALEQEIMADMEELRGMLG